MGVIRRQAIKNNLLAYGGILIGAIAQIFIYPLDMEAKGFADGLIKAALLLYPFLTLGTGVVMVRFVPYVAGSKESARAKLLGVTLKVVATGLLLLGLATWIGGDSLVRVIADYGGVPGPLLEYRWVIFVLAACMTLAAVFTTNLVNYHRTAAPVLFNSLLIKITLPLLILGTAWGYLSITGLVIGLMLTYFVVPIGLLGYTKWADALYLDFSPIEFQEKTRQDAVSMAFYSIFGLLGSALLTSVDVVMINSLLSNTETAVYTFSLFVAGIMLISSNAINAIVLPQVADGWKRRDFAELGQLYRDSSTFLIAIGGLLYVGMVIGLPYFYPLTTGTMKYAGGYYTAVFLGLGMLFNLATSINSPLISYTDYYRWVIAFVFLAGLVNLVLNYYLIAEGEMGILGAAIATSFSLLLYNVVKVVFVYRKMGIHPFSRATGYLTGLYAVIGVLAFLIPEWGPFWLVGISKGILIVLLTYTALRYTSLVPQIREALRAGLRSVF